MRGAGEVRATGKVGRRQMTMAWVSRARQVELYSATMWEAVAGEGEGVLVIGMWEGAVRVTLFDSQCRQLTFAAKWESGLEERKPGGQRHALCEILGAWVCFYGMPENAEPSLLPWPEF